jgi:hypothetical protein
LDMYMKSKSILVKDFQLVGAVALLICCKANDLDLTTFGIR